MAEGCPLRVHVDAVEAPTGLLVLVHGFGHNETHTAVAGRLVDPHRRFTIAAPRGPIDLRKNNAAAWDLPRRKRPELFAASVVQLDALVTELCADHAVDRSQVVLGGFSQGAIIALTLAALPGRPVPRAVVQWCGNVPIDRGIDVDLGRLAGVPVLSLIAARDQIIPVDVMRSAVVTLREAGADVTAEEFDAIHEVTLDMLVATRGWLGALA